MKFDNSMVWTKRTSNAIPPKHVGYVHLHRENCLTKTWLFLHRTKDSKSLSSRHQTVSFQLKTVWRLVFAQIFSLCGVCLSLRDTYTLHRKAKQKKDSRIELTYSQYVQSIAHECIILLFFHMFKHIYLYTTHTHNTHLYRR